MGDIKGFMKYGRKAADMVDPAERTKHFDEHYIMPPEPDVETQASRCMDCGVPFCMSGCPLGNLIPDWNDFVYRGQWKEALDALHATNNFPEFTGRVCPAPCEHSCVLGINEPPVTIKLMEQTIVDYGFKHGLITPEPPKHRSGKTVAIVGSGPAGLACAQQLNRAGHTVTVFEKNDRAGGLMTYGVPDYKLRWPVIERRLSVLEAEGIRFRTSVTVGKDITWDDLQKQFDAVVLATGAETPRPPRADNWEIDGVHYAMEFLPQANRHAIGDQDIEALHPKKLRIDPKGKHVIVIGSGDTASDCIGNCLRLGAASVTNFDYHDEPPENRPENNPWPQWANVKMLSSSLQELLASGNTLAYNANAMRFVDENGTLTGIETMNADWSQGRPPKMTPGSEKTWPCDLALIALGYSGPVKAGLIADMGLELDRRGNVITDDANRMTSVDGVFAAGDCRRGQSLVVWGIAEGREVARCVDEYLTKGPSLLPSVRLEAFAY
jgi:glutamate synthase (NADPH/NADH) small chain